MMLQFKRVTHALHGERGSKSVQRFERRASAPNLTFH